MENRELIVKNAREYVYDALNNEGSGHDWWHVFRVTNNAIEIAKYEEADIYICELAALLHDIADGKLNESEKKKKKRVYTWLVDNGVSSETLDHVMDIVSKMSFKGGNQKENVSTLEGKIVQDADRLDAMGAIGIARVMCYSGHVGRPIHDPAMKPRENLTLEEYRNGKDTAIMHFYEKLLKLKDTMNTSYATKLAQGRHEFLKVYLDQFYQEWDAKR